MPIKKKKKRTTRGLCPSREQIYLKVTVIKIEGIDRKISMKQKKIKKQAHLCNMNYSKYCLSIH